ncbi:MAG: hypothetical protein ACRERR_02740 [Moraxellaceae bacterium]
MRHLLLFLALAASSAQAASNNNRNSNDVEETTQGADPTFSAGLTLSALFINPNPDGGVSGKDRSEGWHFYIGEAF